MILPIEHFSKYIATKIKNFSQANDNNFAYYHFLFNHAFFQIKPINNASDYGFYTPRETRYINNKKQALIDMQKALCAQNYGMKRSKVAQEETMQLQELIEYKQEWLEWQKTQALIITEEFNKQNPALNHLSLEWSSQQLLTHYTHNALYIIAEKWLPQLEDYYQTVEQWIQRRKWLRKKNAIDIAAQNYLNECQQKVAALTQSIAESMLSRLIAYDQSQFKESYSVSHFTRKLCMQGQQIKIPVTKKMRLFNNQTTEISVDAVPCSPENLGEEVFNYFHEYIEKNGSTAVKAKLYKLSWYQNNHFFPISIITTIDGQLFVPQSMANMIPTKKQWPNWWYSQNNQQYEHIRKNAHFIARTQRRLPIAESFIDLQTPSSFQYIIAELKYKDAMLDQKIAENMGKMRQPVRWLASLFNRQHNQYYQEWHNILINYQRANVEDALILAEKLFQSLKGEEMTWDKLMRLFVDNENTFIWLHEIFSGNKVNTIHATDLQDRLLNMRQQLNEFSLLHNISLQLKQIVEGKCFTPAELEALISGIKKLENTGPKIAAFLEIIKNKYLPCIQVNLLRCMQCAMYTTRDIPFLSRNNDGMSYLNRLKSLIGSVPSNTNMSRMAVFYRLIATVAPSEMLKTVENKLIKCMFWYLQQILYAEEIEHDKYDNFYFNYYTRKIIDAMGKDYLWGNKSVYDRIIELEQLYKNNKILWKIKCKSIVLTLGQQYFVEKFTKEANVFQQEMILNLSKSVGALSIDLYADIYNKILDLLKENDYSFGDILPKLSKSEALLLKLDTSASKDVRELLVVCAKIKNLQSTINAMHFAQQFTCVKEMSQSISQVLMTNPLTHKELIAKGVKFGKRPWFFKCYVSEKIIALNAGNINQVQEKSDKESISISEDEKPVFPRFHPYACYAWGSGTFTN